MGNGAVTTDASQIVMVLTSGREYMVSRELESVGAAVVLISTVRQIRHRVDVKERIARGRGEIGQMSVTKWTVNSKRSEHIVSVNKKQ